MRAPTENANTRLVDAVHGGKRLVPMHTVEGTACKGKFAISRPSNQK